jgi:hypothetical protein
MKTNHRRKNPTNGFDYSALNMCARFRVGLGSSHDGGHRGSAKDIKEVKTLDRRQTRRRLNHNFEQEVELGLCEQITECQNA